MSGDIRNFFLPKKPRKPVEDDDDVIPNSPDVQIKNKKKEARKRRVVQDDSDEEVPTSKKKVSLSSEKNKLINDKKKSKLEQKSNLKEVKASEFFGGSIKRTEPIVTKTKKKNTEICIHSDDEFDKSLLELDVCNDVTDNGIKRDESKSVNNESIKTDIIAIEGTPSQQSDSKSYEVDKGIKQEKTTPGKTNQSKNSHPKNMDITNNIDNDMNKIKKASSEDKPDNKRKFSEFIGEIENNVSNDTQEDEQNSKKRKRNKSLNSSVLSDEERHERQRHSAALYQKYLHRSGPKHLGSKEIPEGKPNCLNGYAFLLTGVLDSFEREEITDAITKYGGCVKNSISKKVTHVLAGDEAGPAKISRAQDLGIKIINEDEFLQIIKNSSGATSNHTADNDIKLKNNKKTPDSKKQRSKINSYKKVRNNDNVVIVKEESLNKNSSKNTNVAIKDEMKGENKIDNNKKKISSVNNIETDTKLRYEPDIKRNEESNYIANDAKTNDIKLEMSNSLMWVDKYKPQSLKQIIGQTGDASNVKKLLNWLTKWYANRKAKLSKPNPWAKNDDGGYYKAALLSGPPGVGKTTTVSLVCKELGFDMVEFNASDTRSKTLIKEQISELLTTKSLSAYAKGNTGRQAVTKKHVLVMDEVDGMAGNEDRGGLQELISLIKISSVPIICMCNDRNSQKMRSLVNYCYDLRFNRPRVDQIKSAMLTICFKEGVKVPPDVLSQLIVAAGQDVRQTLNMLSMWTADSRLADADRLRDEATRVKKDMKMGPWEAIRKVFSAEDHKTMSMNDKSDLFFSDYSLIPLFVHENYPTVVPHCHKNEVLDRMSKAADSISLGDLVESRIRGNQAWNLLPVQAMYSCVLPGHHLSGHVGGQVQFPGWLGKNSRAARLHRLCQEIHAHTRLSTSGSKSSIYLDYAAHLRDAIVNPLIKDKSDGINKSLEVLEAYHLLREDLESLTELSLWPGQRNPNVLVDAKVKAAMTRTYNKRAGALPYAPGGVRRARRDDGEELDDDEPDEDHDSLENDALIKKEKNDKKGKATTHKDKAGSSKEKEKAQSKKKKK